MKRFALVFSFVAASLCAQEVHRFTFSAGGGFTEPVGATGRRLNTGWNIQGTAGINFNRWVGAVVQADYNRMNLNGTTLDRIGVPGGDVGIFSATVNPVVHLAPIGRASIYLIGGGGVYHRNQEFTQPGIGSATAFDPFFGFYPVEFATTQVIASSSMLKPGVNGGAGVEFGSRWRGKFFAEARYHRIFMGNQRHTDYIPVTFGFRW